MLNGKGQPTGLLGCPPLRPRLPVSGNADQRGELQVLVGELSEFDTALSSLQLVAENRGLGRPEGGELPSCSHRRWSARKRAAPNFWAPVARFRSGSGAGSVARPWRAR